MSLAYSLVPFGPRAAREIVRIARGDASMRHICSRHISSRSIGAARRTGVFLLGVLDPGGKLLVAHDAHRDRHVGVVLAAELGALAIIHADLGRLEPGLVEAAGNGVDLDAEGRHRERME